LIRLQEYFPKNIKSFSAQKYWLCLFFDLKKPARFLQQALGVKFNSQAALVKDTEKSNSKFLNEQNHF
jgi:hypothetical protein